MGDKTVGPGRFLTQDDINLLAAVANKQCLQEIIRTAQERGYQRVPLTVIRGILAEIEKLIADDERRVAEWVKEGK